MKILIIIVTYNAMRWAEHCFNSLRNSTITPDVYVVDNGSTDGTQAFIQKQYPEVMFHQSGENLGFGKANNLGLQYALDNDYDYVYLLNQDAWVMPDTFEKLIDVSVRHSEYGILSPFQMNADLYHVDRNFVADVCAWESNPNILNDLYNQNVSEVYAVRTVMAAHWFMPISTVRTIGGFSPSFPHYGEDDNYLKRVRYRRLKIGIVPFLRVVHDRGWRERSIEQILYLGFIECINCLSSPQCPFFKAVCLVWYITLSYTIKYKSLIPISYPFRTLCRLKKILNNRRKSITEIGAFLNI